MECTVTDPHNIFKSHFCFVKNYNRNLSTINIGFTTNKPLDNLMVSLVTTYIIDMDVGDHK